MIQTMWERLLPILSDLKKKDTASVKAYFITSALQAYGRSPLLGGQDASDYLHNMGLDDQTIRKMQRKYFLNPHDTRESLERSILEGLK